MGPGYGDVEVNRGRAAVASMYRHSAGAQMQEITGDLKQTQSFLGLASVGITSDVCVHLQPDSEVESMKKLEKTLVNCNGHKPK
jgi:hypothetical protein